MKGAGGTFGGPARRRANHQPSNVLIRPACQALREKIFFFTEYSDYPILLPSRPTKGALRNVNNAGRDAVDADGALDEGTEATEKDAWSCHLDAGVKSVKGNFHGLDTSVEVPGPRVFSVRL